MEYPAPNHSRILEVSTHPSLRDVSLAITRHGNFGLGQYLQALNRRQRIEFQNFILDFERVKRKIEDEIITLILAEIGETDEVAALDSIHTAVAEDALEKYVKLLSPAAVAEIADRATTIINEQEHSQAHLDFFGPQARSILSTEYVLFLMTLSQAEGGTFESTNDYVLRTHHRMKQLLPVLTYLDNTRILDNVGFKVNWVALTLDLDADESTFYTGYDREFFVHLIRTS